MNAQGQKTKTLLVPTDFSVSSRQAAQTAVSLAQSITARIEFLHVRTVAEYTFGSGILPASPEIPQVNPLTQEDIDAMWKNFLFRIEGLDEVEWEQRTTVGQPAATILNRAYEIDSDMIVMGRTTRSGILRFLFPDIARQVTRAAPCTVVAVDPEKPALEPQRRSGNRDDRLSAGTYLPAGEPAWVPSPSFS